MGYYNPGMGPNPGQNMFAKELTTLKQDRMTVNEEQRTTPKQMFRRLLYLCCHSVILLIRLWFQLFTLVAVRFVLVQASLLGLAWNIYEWRWWKSLGRPAPITTPALVASPTASNQPKWWKNSLYIPSPAGLEKVRALLDRNPDASCQQQPKHERRLSCSLSSPSQHAHSEIPLTPTSPQGNEGDEFNSGPHLPSTSALLERSATGRCSPHYSCKSTRSPGACIKPYSAGSSTAYEGDSGAIFSPIGSRGTILCRVGFESDEDTDMLVRICAGQRASSGNEVICRHTRVLFPEGNDDDSRFYTQPQHSGQPDAAARVSPCSFSGEPGEAFKDRSPTTGHPVCCKVEGQHHDANMMMGHVNPVGTRSPDEQRCASQDAPDTTSSSCTVAVSQDFSPHLPLPSVTLLSREKTPCMPGNVSGSRGLFDIFSRMHDGGDAATPQSMSAQLPTIPKVPQLSPSTSGRRTPGGLSHAVNAEVMAQLARGGAQVVRAHGGMAMPKSAGPPRSTVPIGTPDSSGGSPTKRPGHSVTPGTGRQSSGGSECGSVNKPRYLQPTVSWAKKRG